MTPEVAAYTAGLFDGEGSVSIGVKTQKRPSHRPSYALQLTVVNTHKPVLDWLYNQWGGRVYQLKTGVSGSAKGRPPHWSPCWMWYAHKPDMEPFLSAIEPYAIIKKRAVLIGLEFLQTPILGPRRAELFAELRGFPKPIWAPAITQQMEATFYFGE